MGEYERTMAMRASPDEVLAFISDVRNMPEYLPTTKGAQPQGEGRVRVQGEAHGHKYDSDGYLRRDPEGKRLEWGADEGYYSGWMQVRPDGASGCSVTVHISLRGAPPGADPGRKPSDAEIDEALVKSLRSIRNPVEGTGGKEEPSAAT